MPSDPLETTGSNTPRPQGGVRRKAFHYIRLRDSGNAYPVNRPETSPLLVLDTPAVLDAWWFCNPRMTVVREAIVGGRVTWWATPRMRQEISIVTARPALQRWRPEGEHPLARFDQWARLIEPPAPDPRLRCRDASDQGFIDLALALAPAWLLTADRDLLSLARRARARGVTIAGPAAWDTAVSSPGGGAPDAVARTGCLP